jgi:biopolymer transport protein ExbB
MFDVLHVIRVLFERGGWVMYPLLLLSLLSVTFIFERSVFWVRAHGSLKRARKIAEKLRAGDQRGAKALAEDDRSIYGVFTRFLLAEAKRNAGVLTDAAAFATLEDIRPRIERFAVLLSTIITAAPMLGILGTVTGIIQSFRLLGGAAAVTDPSLVADGIAQALFTTAFGLLVALVTLFPYVLFRAHATRALGRMETLAAAMIERGGGGDGGASDGGG